MPMVIAALATFITLGTPHTPKAEKRMTEARVAQAFADAEDDLDVRRSQLGLLGSAPFLGEKSEVAPAPYCGPATGELGSTSRP